MLQIMSEYGLIKTPFMSWHHGWPAFPLEETRVDTKRTLELLLRQKSCRITYVQFYKLDEWNRKVNLQGFAMIERVNQLLFALFWRWQWNDCAFMPVNKKLSQINKNIAVKLSAISSHKKKLFKYNSKHTNYIFIIFYIYFYFYI